MNANVVLIWGWLLVFIATLTYGPLHPRALIAGGIMIFYGAWLAARNR